MDAEPTPGIGFGDTRYVLLSALINIFLQLTGRIVIGDTKKGCVLYTTGPFINASQKTCFLGSEETMAILEPVNLTIQGGWLGMKNVF